MTNDVERRIVITGGPGAGKTSLIDALRGAGVPATAEVGRRIIKAQQAIGGRALPWIDPALFAELMLAMEIDNHDAAGTWSRPGLCDRGVPDVLGYLRLCGIAAPDHVRRAAERYRYNARVLIAPPWPEIFTQDTERKQTAAEAERTHDALAETYAGLGYRLVELPRVGVAARVAFVMSSGLID